MDKRNANNMSVGQRRAINRKMRGRPKARALDRLEAAKNVLRRSGNEVFEASLTDPNLAGYIWVGVKKYKPAQVLKMATDILKREDTRNRELRALYGLGRKR
jgi:hypothetical protein